MSDLLADPMPALSALAKVNFHWVTALENVWNEEQGPLIHNVEILRLVEREAKSMAESTELRSPIGRVILGEGGSGKTHLAQALHIWARGSGYHFVLVDCTDVNNFWETVLHSYVKSLQRVFKGKTQLEKILLRLWNVAGFGASDDYFEKMSSQDSSVVLEHTESLLSKPTVVHLLGQANQKFGSHIVRQIIRALYLLNSKDERLNDLGNTWLLGVGLETAEAQELKLTNSGPGYSPINLVKGMSWLMALSGPTVLILDQLDPIIAEAQASAGINDSNNDQMVKAKAIIEELGGGLRRLVDNTFRTLSMVMVLPKSWKILTSTTLSTNLAVFHEPITLLPVRTLEALNELLRNRLDPAYNQATFTPPYPTYPFPSSVLAELVPAGLYPRQILRKFADHRERCLLHGNVAEFKLIPDPIIPPTTDKFTALMAQKVKVANIDSLLDEKNEDQLGERLVSFAEAMTHEFAKDQSATWTFDPQSEGGSYPALHSRLRRIEHGKEREEHTCFRALLKTNASAFKARLGAAMTEAGIDQKLAFRRLVIVRNTSEIPGGAKTKEVYAKYVAAGGKICTIPPQELKVLEVVHQFLKAEEVGFTAWLAKARPLSNLGFVKSLFPDGCKPIVTPTPVVPNPVDNQKGDTDLPTVLLGQRISGSPVSSEVRLEIGALCKHVLIRAGSGSGKSVCVKRLIEEAALLGIPSIVIDPGNDLSWLGTPWATQPPGWGDLEKKKAQKLSEKVEVVIWTPGRLQGRPLNLPVLPDFKALDDEIDLRNEAISMAADSLIPLCAKGKGDKATLKAGVLTAALKTFSMTGGNLADFVAFLKDIPPEATGGIAKGPEYAGEMANLLKAAIQQNPLISDASENVIDISVLLGIGKPKTRISVISLIGLSSVDKQQHFLNQLAVSLFTWVKKNPSLGVQGMSGLFILDEAKPFLPAIGSSPCKKSLMALTSQARKYGLGMILATQNPKDIDYNATANFATQLFGYANAPQVIDYIDEMLVAKGGTAGSISQLKQGQFFVVSEKIVPMKFASPLCFSNHPDKKPMTESEIIQKAKLPKA